MGKKRESGMVIVEASIVFPVMFLVIFLMIFAGNAYLQKCRVEAIVTSGAIRGAANCASPMLSSEEGSMGVSYSDDNIRPYRYLFGGMGDISGEIESQVSKKITGLSTGLFADMKPTSTAVTAEYHNGFVYSTFSVDASYSIRLPIKLLGEKNNIIMELSSHMDMPVSDSTEFIRNVNMVEDYMTRFGVTQKISELIGKVKSWFSPD